MATKKKLPFEWARDGGMIAAEVMPALSRVTYTAAELDGDGSNYLSGVVSSPNLNLVAGKTLLAIVRVAGGTTGLLRYGTNTTGGWSLFFVSGVPNIQTYNGGQQNNIVTGLGLSAGLHALAFTVVSGTLRCCDDGGAIRTVSYTNPNAPASNLITIGDGIVIHPSANEAIIEFLMIDRSLTDEEMQAATALGSGTAPLGHRAAFGSTVTDEAAGDGLIWWRAYEDWDGGSTSIPTVGNVTFTATGSPVRNDLTEEEIRLDDDDAETHFHALRRFEDTGSLRRHNGGAFLRFTTSVTSMAVRYAKISQNNPIDVWSNGSYVSSLSSSIGTATHVVRDVTLPSGDGKIVELWEDGVLHHDLVTLSPDGDSGSVYIQGVRATPGSISIAPPPTTDVLVCYGDSITSGFGATVPRNSWAYLTRADYPGRVAVEAFSSRQMLRDDSDDEEFMVNMRLLFRNASSRTMVILIGTNDWGVEGAAIEDFGPAYEAKLDALINEWPDIQIYCSLLPRTDQATPNAAGDTLADWQAALEILCDARPSNCTWLTPASLLTIPAGLSDAVHPNDVGYAQIYAALKVAIGYA